MKKNNVLQSVAIAFILCCSFGNAYAVEVGEITTATADIVFASSGTSTIKITPVENLMSDKHARGTKFADVAMTSTAGTLAYRWTPGTFDKIEANSDGIKNKVTISGTGNKDNKLSLYVDTANTQTDASKGAEGWIVTKSQTTDFSTTVVNDVEKVVSPDTYVISLDSVVWAE